MRTKHEFKKITFESFQESCWPVALQTGAKPTMTIPINLELLLAKHARPHQANRPESAPRLQCQLELPEGCPQPPEFKPKEGA